MEIGSATAINPKEKRAEKSDRKGSVPRLRSRRASSDSARVWITRIRIQVRMKNRKAHKVACGELRRWAIRRECWVGLSLCWGWGRNWTTRNWGGIRTRRTRETKSDDPRRNWSRHPHSLCSATHFNVRLHRSLQRPRSPSEIHLISYHATTSKDSFFTPRTTGIRSTSNHLIAMANNRASRGAKLSSVTFLDAVGDGKRRCSN